MVTIQRTQTVLSDDVKRKLGSAMDDIRDELDDHRLAINETTQEVASTNEAVNALHLRMDKLTERLEELSLLIKGDKKEPDFQLQPLNNREKEVFAALYELTESQPAASYVQIARKCALTKQLVMTYMTSIIQKGVPVLKRTDGSKVYLRLDPVFKAKQAVENLVGLNARLTSWL